MNKLHVTHKPTQMPMLFDEMSIENFAGGGGWSEGFKQATGRDVDVAINHDPEALAMHAINNPHTLHLCESVWAVNPLEVTRGRRVGSVHLSPDCKHFSKAKGGKPVDKNIRGLAWIGTLWAMLTNTRILTLENVSEFLTWGPLVSDGKGNYIPDPKCKGETFDGFVKVLRDGISPKHPAWNEAVITLGIQYDIKEKLKLYKGLGYKVEWKELRACDYGAPTIRKRLFLIARNDGEPIVWPEATHGEPNSEAVKSGELLPWETAASCIDFNLPCPSIFDRKKPLAENTLRRITKGLQRYVIDNQEPFIVPENIAPFITEHANASNQRNMKADDPLRTQCAQVKGGHFDLVSANISRQFGKSVGSDARDPVGTIMSNGLGKTALVSAFLAKHYTGVVGAPVTGPVHTVTTLDHHSLVTSNLVKLRGTNVGEATNKTLHTISAGGTHHAEVRAFLIKSYGTDQAPQLNEPMHTCTTKERFGLVTVKGIDYVIVDIGMRMLQPRELFRAQGFDDDYIIGDDPEQGLKLTKTAQVRMCGNSVPPPFAKAIVSANYVSELVTINKKVAA